MPRTRTSESKTSDKSANQRQMPKSNKPARPAVPAPEARLQMAGGFVSAEDRLLGISATWSNEGTANVENAVFSVQLADISIAAGYEAPAGWTKVSDQELHHHAGVIAAGDGYELEFEVPLVKKPSNTKGGWVSLGVVESTPSVARPADSNARTQFFANGDSYFF